MAIPIPPPILKSTGSRRRKRRVSFSTTLISTPSRTPIPTIDTNTTLNLGDILPFGRDHHRPASVSGPTSTATVSSPSKALMASILPLHVKHESLSNDDWGSEADESNIAVSDRHGTSALGALSDRSPSRLSSSTSSVSEECESSDNYSAATTTTAAIAGTGSAASMTITLREREHHLEIAERRYAAAVRRTHELERQLLDTQERQVEWEKLPELEREEHLQRQEQLERQTAQRHQLEQQAQLEVRRARERKVEVHQLCENNMPLATEAPGPDESDESQAEQVATRADEVVRSITYPSATSPAQPPSHHPRLVMTRPPPYLSQLSPLAPLFPSLPLSPQGRHVLVPPPYPSPLYRGHQMHYFKDAGYTADTAASGNVHAAGLGIQASRIADTAPNAASQALVESFMGGMALEQGSFFSFLRFPGPGEELVAPPGHRIVYVDIDYVVDAANARVIPLRVRPHQHQGVALHAPCFHDS